MSARSALPRLAAALLLALLAACSSAPTVRDGAPSQPKDVSNVPDAVPRLEPRARYGNPESYEALGRRYYVLPSNRGYVERGIASWYGTKFHGQLTSTRERYDMYAMTAAHKTLPLPTYARVTNLRNGRSVVVRINDRGPFVGNRIIDLSYAAAHRLGIIGEGTGLVEVRALQPGEPEPAVQVATAAAAKGTHSFIPAVEAAPAPAVSAVSTGVEAAPTPAVSTVSAGVAASADTPAPVQPLKAPQMFLQVGAFASRDNAESLARKLGGALDATIRVNPARLGERLLYRVRIGPVATVDDADRLSARVTELGLEEPQVVVE